MRLSLSIPTVVLLALAVSGCGPSGVITEHNLPHAENPDRTDDGVVLNIVRRTPEKAVQAYQQALAHKDWAGCWNIVHQKSQEEFNQQAEIVKQKMKMLPPGPERDVFEDRLAGMGYTTKDAHYMTGQMLLTGMLKSWLENDPDGFRTFVEAEVVDHQEAGRDAWVSIKVQGEPNPRHVITRRYGVLWYVCPDAPDFQ